MKNSLQTKELTHELKRYIVPGILGLLANSVYVVVDGIFVARMLGAPSLAAITTVVPILEFMLALSMMIAVGSGVYISIHLAKETYDTARSYFMHGFFLITGTTLLLAGLLLLFRTQTVRLLGATPDIADQAQSYYSWFVAFVPFFTLNYALGVWIRNDGKPRLAMLSQILGALINIVLDYVFMGPLQMGVAGAAIATGLGPVFGVVLLAPHFLRRQGRIYFAKVKLSVRAFRDILYSGFPAFTVEFVLGEMTLIMNVFISAKMGSQGLSAFGAIGYINLIFLSIFLGAGEGVQPVVSRKYGMRKAESISYIYNYKMRHGFIIGLLAYVLIVLFRYPIAAVFIDPADTALTRLTVSGMLIFFATFSFVGINVGSSFVLQAKHSIQASIAISFLRSVLFLIPLLILFSRFENPNWLWAAYPLSELMTGPIAAALWKREENRMILGFRQLQ